MLYKRLFFALLGTAVLFSALSCASIPQKVQDDFNAAKARAEKARGDSLAVQAQVYFPDDWNAAEANYENGKKSDTTNKNAVVAATALYTSAAETWESITGKSSPIFAKDMDEAGAILQASKTRAEQSRQNAQDNQGPKYLPEDWEAAESEYRKGENAPKKIPAEIKAAADLYTTAADGYDDVAVKSAALAAQERKETDAALQAAVARADKSRQGAQNVQAATYFAEDWQSAETALKAAKDTPKDTIDDIKAATEQFTAVADAYDDLAARSQPLFAKDEAVRKEAAQKAADAAKKAADDAKKAADAAKKAQDDAQKALAAATARADKSRTAAMDVNGQTYFANDWKTAESRLQAAKSAKKSNVDEMKAATAQFNGAADAYDSITSKSRPMFTKDKDAATKALQTAVTRAQQSRTAATNAGGQANSPAEWKTAEAKNQSANNAKRGTIAEMNAAVPLYNAAADAYDDIVRKNSITREKATDAVTKAKARYEQSADFAAATARELEGNNAE